MTLADWQTELATWTAARDKILTGNQSYTSPDGSSYTRADLAEINKQIRICRTNINVLSGGFVAQQVVFGGRR